MDPAHYVRLPMEVVDSRGSHDDAYVADKSQHYGSNGSSKQHDVEQMMLVRLVDAFVRKPSHTARPADELHVVEVPDSSRVSVCVSSVAATNVDCRLDAAVRDDKSDADSC